MSTLSTLKQAVYDDIYPIVDNYVTNPHNHLIREEDGEPDSPPMIALSGQTRERSNGNSKTGIHDVRVLELFSNPFDVKFGREKTFSVDVTISDIDGDRADTIHSKIQNVFEYNGRFRDPDSFVSSVPIDEIRVSDSSPTDRDQRIGHTVSIEIDYLRTFLYSEVDDPPSVVTEIVSQYENKTVTTVDTSVTLSE